METEAKFRVPDAATLARLSEAPTAGPYAARDERTKQVQDRYMDTADGRFRARGFAARLRQEPDDLLLTLKGLGGANGAIHERAEYETAVPGPDIGSWPEGEARHLAEEIAGDAPLTDLVTLTQARRVRTLFDGERAVAEWSLDDVTIPAESGSVQFYECEVELLADGTPEDLERVTRTLTEEYGLLPQPESKFERALRVSGIEGPRGADADTAPLPSQAPLVATAAGEARAAEAADAARPLERTMGAVGRTLLRTQVAALRRHEKDVRADSDPVAIHRMRVATRRGRAILRLARPYLPKKAVARIEDPLHGLADDLGAVRDLDVLIGNAFAFRAVLPEDQQADMDGLLAHWTARRAKAQTRLCRRLDSAGYRRLKKDLRRLSHAEEGQPKADATVQPVQVRHRLGSVVWAQFEAVRAYETVMPEPAIGHLHALRIEAKKLRYTLEFFLDTLPDDAKGLVADVTTLQDILGALHDADIAAGLIRDFLARTEKHGSRGTEHPPGLVAYLTDRQDAVAASRRKFQGGWATVCDPQWRTRLAAAIASV